MTYADSSIIVKRCYEEPGSGRVHERWLMGEPIFTAGVAYAEVHAALARKLARRRTRACPVPPLCVGVRDGVSRL